MPCRRCQHEKQQAGACFGSCTSKCPAGDLACIEVCDRQIRSPNLRPDRWGQRYEFSSLLSDRQGRPFMCIKRRLLGSPEYMARVVTRDQPFAEPLLNCPCRKCKVFARIAAERPRNFLGTVRRT